MNTFKPRLEVLPGAQRRLWNEFQTAQLSTFVLYGGTALALRSGSRESEDFDFFSNLPIDAQKVRVVQVRAERKDYLDLMTLLAHGVSLPQALGAAQALYPDFAPLVSLKALSYFGDGDLAALPEGVKRGLSDAAAKVRVPDPVVLVSERLT